MGSPVRKQRTHIIHLFPNNCEGRSWMEWCAHRDGSHKPKVKGWIIAAVTKKEVERDVVVSSPRWTLKVAHSDPLKTNLFIYYLLRFPKCQSLRSVEPHHTSRPIYGSFSFHCHGAALLLAGLHGTMVFRFWRWMYLDSIALLTRKGQRRSKASQPSHVKSSLVLARGHTGSRSAPHSQFVHRELCWRHSNVGVWASSHWLR